MPAPEVWFAVPSANPENCRCNLPRWRERGYRIAILQNRTRAEIPADIVVWRDAYPGWAESINILCREAVPKDAPIVVSGGDDMLPDPNHTAQDLATEFLSRFPDTFGVMQPHGDEFLCARRYCGSPFLGRKWIDTMYGGRGPMCGQYHHNWADNELYWVARGLGALWERDDLSHFHDHFTREGRRAPDYWECVRNSDLSDAYLYFARAYADFPGHEPIGGARRYDRPELMAEIVLLAQNRVLAATRDNPFSRAVAQALDRCAAAGQSPVALYGTGYHTLNAVESLARPPVRIDCLIDDSPVNQGQTLWNFPIVSREEALRRGVRAVILSANSVEGRLWDNSECFLRAGIPVHRLYPAPKRERRERLETAIARATAQGIRRIALFGSAGEWEGLQGPEIERRITIVGALVGHHGGENATGRPPIPIERAAAAGIEGIVIASWCDEPKLFEQTAPLRRAGIRVFPMYWPGDVLAALERVFVPA